MTRTVMSVQTGKGGYDFPVYRGISRQYGNGLGSVFKTALRTIIPIIKPVAKASLENVKQVAKTQGLKAAQEILGGANVKQVLTQRGKAALQEMGQKALSINSSKKTKKPQSKTNRLTGKTVKKSKSIHYKFPADRLGK